jgi:caa(3)-type oxidase subunit IV
MSGTSVEEIRKHVRVYIIVFVALLVLTGITVALAEAHFLSTPMAIVAALIVACVKGSLVACYFMHLISERGMIFWILGICALFFIVLLLLPIFTELSNVSPVS